MIRAVEQLRELSRPLLVPGIRYISAVSGGVRCAIPFTYYPAGARDDRVLLGRPIEPKDITWDLLSELPPGYLCQLGVRGSSGASQQLALDGVPRSQA